MGSMTALLVAGSANLYHGGIYPIHAMWRET